ncbi:esterase/lipase family protein [Paenibacillus sp. GCM10023250]|uniref:esterase/lipase family protein n=1 Tax=Paenibacillus sp. GCM10023250 TaxID=3252648 RepID=UPI0036190E0D
MARRPIVLIHGYSGNGRSFRTWVDKLIARGYDPQSVHVCSYETLTNEVTIPDIAEAFDRALRERVGLMEDEPFDAIVHSTGMLVLRAWLTVYAKRRDRLKHLVGLAPATFGSPLAHKGRSWLGGVFKGRKEMGPDFLEAGDRVLDALELGSRFTWELAEKDLLGSVPCYGPNGDTPYVFIFCGTEGYGGIKKLLSEPGTDGTVRWAGCGLNVRKIKVDMTLSAPDQRIAFSAWSNVNIPMLPVAGADHGSILSKPPEGLVDMVHAALGVEDGQALAEWKKDADSRTTGVLTKLAKWQQFVIRARDERGDPIQDYYIQLVGRRNQGRAKALESFALDVHTYNGDASLRSFHVNLDKLDPGSLQSLSLKVIASSGSSLVAYSGCVSAATAAAEVHGNEGTWQAELDLSSLLGEREVKFFYPFTTTLVELKLNREPLPLTGPNRVCRFIEPK